MRDAAEYFAKIPWNTPWIKVVEAATVPKTRSAAGMWMSLENNETEPIGSRIVEMPANNELVELRDYHQEGSFVAYVPPGSIKKGEALAKGGGGKTIQCDICHGEKLTGLGELPRLAGLQPVYVARQLIQMQNGSSAGANAALMNRVVAKLTEDDIISLAAYVGSLPPK